MRSTGDGTGGDLALSGCCLLKSRWTSSQQTWLLRPELLMLGRVSREEEKRTLDMSVSLLEE